MENKRQALGGLIACGLLAVVTVGYLVMALGLPSGPENSTDLGAGTYPVWVGILLAALTLTMAVQSILQLKRAAPGRVATKRQSSDGRRTLVTLVGSVLLTAAYVAAFEPVGFIIATTLYLAVFAMIFRGRKPAGARDFLMPLVFGIVTSFALNALFVYLLGVLLPLGLFGF
ncbi:tripartite tricarboxylate transporter TctB family protein [Spelaeicoccus albus]|uniref:DUF1468 domain-containing protein n=1 Tax=Spelaeicoccus albus TaxID=1280376 RepID=A0A7Z0AB32_9MICO|nr:tripartite tricarboxylate transporter TctB family protein [Spelaeicoccus albus]NYI66855.1 hypothetical protein [Spelaeicoccus albus]